MKVSILIPCKNASMYLDACLSSIVRQTYANWECIIINDHSTDNSWEIIQLYSKDTRVKSFQNNGKGIIDALQLAFEKSEGQFITRMDADDIMPEVKLQLMVDKLIVAKTPTVVTGLVKYFTDDGEILDGYKRYEQWMNENLLSENPFKDIFKECVIPSPAWMVNREVIDAIGGFKNLTYPEDYDLVFHFWHMGLEVATIPEVIHLWRDHAVRASRTDDNYSENTFLPLKLHWLTKKYKGIGFHVIGAGKKGKQIANYLIGDKHLNNWYTNNYKKLKVPIYGVKLKELETSDLVKGEKYIVAIANKQEVKEIEQKMKENQMARGVDYLPFC